MPSISLHMEMLPLFYWPSEESNSRPIKPGAQVETGRGGSIHTMDVSNGLGAAYVPSWQPAQGRFWNIPRGSDLAGFMLGSDLICFRQNP